MTLATTLNVFMPDFALTLNFRRRQKIKPCTTWKTSEKWMRQRNASLALVEKHVYIVHLLLRSSLFTHRFVFGFSKTGCLCFSSTDFSVWYAITSERRTTDSKLLLLNLWKANASPFSCTHTHTSCRANDGYRSQCRRIYNVSFSCSSLNCIYIYIY